MSIKHLEQGRAHCRRALWPYLIAALHSCKTSTALREVQADVLLRALPVIHIMLIGCWRRRIPRPLMLPTQAN